MTVLTDLTNAHHEAAHAVVTALSGEAMMLPDALLSAQVVEGARSAT